MTGSSEHRVEGWKNSRVTTNPRLVAISQPVQLAATDRKIKPANKYGHTYRRMICRSHYTTLHDACVLFDRVLTPFILVLFLSYQTDRGTGCVTAMIKNTLIIFALRVELPIFVLYIQRGTQGPARQRNRHRSGMDSKTQCSPGTLSRNATTIRG